MIFSRSPCRSSQRAAEPAAERVGREVAGDRAGPHDRDQHEQRDLPLAGDEAADDHRGLARRDEAEERAGLEERERADDAGRSTCPSAWPASSSSFSKFGQVDDADADQHGGGDRDAARRPGTSAPACGGGRSASPRAPPRAASQVHFMRPPPRGSAAGAAWQPRRERRRGRRDRPNTVGPEPVTIGVRRRRRRAAPSSAGSIGGHSRRAAASRSLTGGRRRRRAALAPSAASSAGARGRSRRVELAVDRPAVESAASSGTITSAGGVPAGQRLDVLAGAGHQRAAGVQQRPGRRRRGRIGELAARIARPATPRGEPQRGGGVARPAAHAGRDRDPLVDRQPLRRLVPAGRRAERRERAARRGSRPSTPGQTTSSAAGRLQRQLVGERRPAGRPRRAGAGRRSRGAPTNRHRLTLPGGARGQHSALRTSSRHSRGRERLGARVGRLADRLQRGARAVADRRVRAGRERERARERLAAVREAAAARARAAPGGGAGRGARRPTSTESTFGTGWKTVREIVRSTRTSHASWASTDGTP